MNSKLIKHTICLGAATLLAASVAPAMAGELTAPFVQAQKSVKKVNGTVTDDVGEVVGASVMIKGTNIGTVTDVEGKFSINAKKGDILVISYVGYATVEVQVGDGPVSVKMREDNTQLSEVVVTALGVKRDRKALGYGLAEVKGEELTKAKETNLMNSLSGKVAGLVVQQTAGGASGSTRVQLRGATEMSGNNQPLYVIDGVPLDNTNFGSAGQAGGYDLGDGISAINPDDIETMTVLKGPAASALYGSRASHGVILITTKKAEKEKFSVEYNGSLTIDTQSASWDNVQRVYGQGANGAYAQDATSLTNSSWGPKADSNEMTYFDGVTRPTYMYDNNADGFFRTGLTTQNTAIISANSGKTGIRFSVTDMRNKDILPNTNMNRDNFNLRVNTSLGKVDFDFNANYTHEGVKNRPALGDSQSNVGKNLMTLANTFNHEWLKKYQNEDGTYANWNGNDQYNKNPYWDLYKNKNMSHKNVFRLAGKAIYNINSHLKLQGTIGADLNFMNFEDFIAKTTPGKAAGQMTKQNFENSTINAEILALYNNSWGDYDFNATFGGNIYRVDNLTTNITAMGQQMSNLEALMNYEEQNVRENTYVKQINSIYGSASVGYKHTYYLEGTLRGDKSSTLPVGNNTYVYPSVSASLVFSEFLKNKDIINYGKLRASWAKVGSDTNPYQLALNYSTAKFPYPGATIGKIDNDIQPNKDLKPTMTTSYELGLEMKFLHNRLGLDVTYYDQKSRDQIIQLPSSSTSGYAYNLVNAGLIENRGIEIALNGRAFQHKDFAIDAGINFSKNSNKVKELVPGMDYFTLERATWCNVQVAAKVGADYGAILGPDFKRNAEGQVIVNPETGLPQYDSNLQTLGNSTWDWTGGGYLTFSYRNLRLSAAFDVKVGADIFSMSMRSAYETGKAAETLAGRDEWYQSEEERMAAGYSLSEWRGMGKAQGYVVDGVIEKKDAEGNVIGYDKNEIAVNPEQYWQSVSRNAPGQFVYDNSYVKCREITLTYQLPSKWLKNVVQGVNVSFVARNPFIIWKNIPNIDPDSGYNTSGFGLEYGSLPSRRSYGLNVNVKF